MIRMWLQIAVLFLLVVIVACSEKSGNSADSGTDADTDGDSDSDGDTDGDTDTDADVPVIAGCQIFPADNMWNTPVDELSVHPLSDTYIASIGGGSELHPDFGTFWESAPIGIPYTMVPEDQPMVDVSFYYDDESDPGPYPIPPDAPIEGGASSDGDRHVLVIREGVCVLYEMYDAWPNADTIRIVRPWACGCV